MAECPVGRPCAGIEWDSRDLMFPGPIREGTGFVTCCESFPDERLIQLAPWGEQVDPLNLRYLATITPAEQTELLEFVVGALNDCWWGGLDPADGIHEDPALNEINAEICRRQLTADHLTEGFIAGYANDLAGELRWMRGWCPHEQWDHEKEVMYVGCN